MRRSFICEVSQTVSIINCPLPESIVYSGLVYSLSFCSMGICRGSAVSVSVMAYE